eukprot:546944_1
MASTNNNLTDFDVSAFTISTSQCQGVQTSCDYTRRVLCGLIYYSLLAMHKQSLHDFNIELIKFVKQIYSHLLNDFIHIIQHHNTDLYYISHSMLHDYNINCDPGTCSSVHRRCRNSIQICKDNNSFSDDYIFYRNLLDCIHCYLIHSYDTGLRIKDDTYDIQFSRIRQLIKETQNSNL